MDQNMTKEGKSVIEDFPVSVTETVFTNFTDPDINDGMLESPAPTKPPFYGSYVVFFKALRGLKKNAMPRRISSAIFTDLHDEASRIVAGFTGLGWLDDVGFPQSDLIRLVEAFDTPNWKSTLIEVVPRSYSFLPRNVEDFSRDDFDKAFKDYIGRDLSSTRNGITFFLCLAYEAGYTLTDEMVRRATRGVAEAKKWLQMDKYESGESVPFERVATKVTDETEVPDTVEMEGRQALVKSRDLAMGLVSLIGKKDVTEQERSAFGTVLAYLSRHMSE